MNYMHKNSDSKIKKNGASSKQNNGINNKDGRSSSAMAMQSENIDM